MIAATAVAVIAAVLYSVSPLTIWATVLLAVMLWWASRDLPRGQFVAGARAFQASERHWFLSLSLFALALRYAALGLLPLLGSNRTHSFRTFFGDDFYNIQRSLWLHHIVAGIPISPWDFFDAFQPIYGRSGYQYMLAFAHVIAGPSPYGVLLVNVVLHSAAVVLIYRLVRNSFGAVPALGSAVLLWFYPTLFGWSVSALKEPPQFFLTVVALVAAIEACRARSWPARVAAMGVVALALLAILPLRNGALAIAVAGLAAGFTLRIVTFRSWTFVAAVTVAIIALATVLPPARVMRMLQPELLMAVRRHMGHVLTGGDSYKLLDDSVYFRYLMAASPTERLQVQTLSPPDAIEFLARAGAAFFVEPGVRSVTSAKWLAVVPQQIVWYAAVLFAIPGAIFGMRRDSLVTCMLCGLVVGGVVVVAPNSGNIGTLIRHRDMISPFVFVLAATGLVSAVGVVGRWARDDSRMRRSASLSRLRSPEEHASCGEARRSAEGAKAAGERDAPARS